MKMPAEILERKWYLGHVDGLCPYLRDRQANHLFLDGRPIGEAYRVLLDAGYRRHGCVVYRTDCPACRECKIIRVPLAAFQKNRSQRRVWKTAESLFTVRLTAPSYSREKAALYHTYLRRQHSHEADPVDEGRYTDFFVNTFLGNQTLELQLLAGKRLAGVGILDYIGDALSAVYFYYDPEFARYSPGTYAILKEIQLASAWGLNYFYPGYYIAECPSMNYKRRFRPCQIKDAAAGVWRGVD